MQLMKFDDDQMNQEEEKEKEDRENIWTKCTLIHLRRITRETSFKK